MYDALNRLNNVELYVQRQFLSSVITFNIKGLSAQQTADLLNNRYGIGTRAGNFCVYHMIRKLLKITDEQKLIDLVQNGHSDKLPGVVRASFGLQNTLQDAKRFIEAVREIVQNLNKETLK